MKTKKYKIGIVGATGYTGSELLRLLSTHEYVDVHVLTSRKQMGHLVCDIFPFLRSVYPDLKFSEPNTSRLTECDIVFFATPNGVAMNHAPALLKKNIKVIDLSADYRIRNVKTWEKWYKMPHSSPEYIHEAVYGLPELYAHKIAQASLIANPGCYPTAVSLALLPLLQGGYLENAPIIADCKSGISGAGRKMSIPHLFSETSDNFKAYGITGHRHLPEIRQTIDAISPNTGQHFVFIPHLVPMIRGMQATIYVQSNADVSKILQQAYQHHHFVDVLPQGICPETRSVRGSNLCRLSAHQATESADNVWVILSVIDNLVKGAAGQAIQNMNLMCKLPESTGLNMMPCVP